MNSIIIKQSFIGNVSYFLQFFVFFVYQMLLSLEIIPPFFGAYWGNMSLFLLLPLLSVFIFFGNNSVIQVTKIDKVVYIFLLFLICNLIANTILDKNFDIIVNRVAAIVQFMSIFFIFRLINLQSKRFIKSNRNAWLLLVVLTCYTSINNILNLSVVKVNENEAYLVSYQLLGMVFVIISLVTAVYIKKSSIRAILYIFSFVSLFLNGARSEIVGFFIGIVVIESILNSLAKKIFLAVFLPLLLYVGFILATIFNPESRILLLFSKDRDGSVDQRSILFEKGIDNINNNPIFGSFGSHEPGEYIHNVFSAWLDLGILGFIIYLFILIVPFVQVAIKVYLEKQKSLELILALSFLTISLILVIFAKNYTYLMLPVGLGIYSNYIAKKFKKRVNI